jgi:hypothetical protein
LRDIQESYHAVNLTLRESIASLDLLIEHANCGMSPVENVLRPSGDITMRSWMPHLTALVTSLPLHQPTVLRESIMYSLVHVQHFSRATRTKYPKSNSILRGIKLSLHRAIGLVECGTQIRALNSKSLMVMKTKSFLARSTTKAII